MIVLSKTISLLKKLSSVVGSTKQDITSTLLQRRTKSISNNIIHSRMPAAIEITIDLNNKEGNNDFSQVNWDSLSDVIISGIANVEVLYRGLFKADATRYISELFQSVDYKTWTLPLAIKQDLAMNYLSSRRMSMQKIFPSSLIGFGSLTSRSAKRFR